MATGLPISISQLLNYQISHLPNCLTTQSLPLRPRSVWRRRLIFAALSLIWIFIVRVIFVAAKHSQYFAEEPLLFLLRIIAGGSRGRSGRRGRCSCGPTWRWRGVNAQADQ